MIDRRWIVAVMALWTLAAHAVHINNMEIKLQPTQGAEHGVREVEFVLTNLENRNRGVELTLRGQNGRYQEKPLSRLTRRVSVPAGATVSVIMMLPNMSFTAPKLELAIDGRTVPPELLLDIQILARHLYYGGVNREINVLVSQGVPGNSGKFYKPPKTSGGATVEYAASTLPAAQWSVNAATYGGYGAVFFTVAEYESASPELKTALTDYAALGGVLVKIGEPRTRKMPNLQSEPYGFGYIVTTGTEPERFSETDWKTLNAHWKQSRDGVAILTADNTIKETVFNQLLACELGKLPTQALLGVLLLFALLVGPVNYFILWKRKKLLLLLVTTPLISLVFSMFILSYTWVFEGLIVRQGVAATTFLNQHTHRAATVGAVAIYGTVAPRQLVFPAEAEILPGFGSAVNGGNPAIDADAGQLLSGGWVQPRIPALLGFRIAELRRERLNVRRIDRKHIEITNALGAEITTLALKMPDGTRFEARQAIAPGETVRLSGVTGASGTSGATFNLRRYFSNGKWYELTTTAAAQLPPGSYYAQLKGAPLVTPVLESDFKTEKSTVFGLFSPEAAPEVEKHEN